MGSFGGKIVGGIVGSHGSDEASEYQLQAAREANALQERMYNQTRADQEPWRQAGLSALGQMGNADFQRDFTQNDFQYDPGYQFRMQEGQKAIERSAASRGGSQSGGALKALAQYGQNFASNEYQNAYNRFNNDRNLRYGRLSTLAGIGQGATNQGQMANQNYADNSGNIMLRSGDNQAAARMYKANTWSGVANDIGKTIDSAIMMGAGGMPGGGGGGGGGMNWMSQSESSLDDMPGYGGGRTYGLAGRK